MSQKRINMIVCGHIDHGKSTFVGRLLTELGLISKDRLDYLQASQQAGQKLEYAQLVDALADEKSKGITIGLSQLAFKYQNQNYAFYDAPGHFEFMQNMITGAARADVAFLLIDAGEGIKESTLRHLYALSFIGVKKVVLLINKMDLVHYSEQRFVELTELIKIKMRELDMTFTLAIPIVAYTAENFCSASTNMSWYAGPQVATLLTEFQRNEDVKIDDTETARLIVQDVFHFEKKKIIFAELIQGQIEDSKVYSTFGTSGFHTIQLSSHDVNNKACEQISLYQGDQQKSFYVDEGLDNVYRGTFIYEKTDSDILFVDHLKCSVFWFGSSSLSVGEKIVLRLAKQEVTAEVTAVEKIFDCENLSYQHEDQILKKGRVAICYFKTARSVFCDHFVNDSKLGRIVLIKDHVIVAAGKIRA